MSSDPDLATTLDVVRASRRAWWNACAWVTCVVVLWFSPWIFGGRVLAPLDILTEMFLPWRDVNASPDVRNHFVSDAVTQYIPYRLFAEASFEQDGYLGWNPLILGGVAQHANTMGTYFDWTVQLHRVLAFWEAWHLGLIAQFLVAGTGMLTLLWCRGCRPSVALAGALAFMTNWQFIVWVFHRWSLGSFCWLPWALFGIRAWRRGSLRWGAAVPGFVALALMGGTLQHAAFVVIALACVWLGWLWDERSRPDAVRHASLAVFVWGLTAAGLAAGMLEPTIRAYWASLETGLVRGSLGYEHGWLQPVKTLASYPFYAYPFLFGTPQTIDLWKALDGDLFHVGFFGTVPVVLAVLGAASRRVATEARLLCLAGLAIPLTPLVGPLYHRVHLLWILGGCWAGAEWLETAAPAQLRRLARRLGVAAIAFAAIWAAVSIALVVADSRIEPLLRAAFLERASQSHFGHFTEWMSQRPAKFLHLLRLWHPVQSIGMVGLGLSVAGLWTLASPNGLRRNLLAAGVVLQSTGFWFQWTTWSDEHGRDPYRNQPWIEVLRAEVGDGRLSLASGSAEAELTFPPNTLVPAGVAISAGYDSIHPHGMSVPREPWAFPGVTHHLAPATDPAPSGWSKVTEKAGLALYRNPGQALVRVYPDSPRAPVLHRPTLNTKILDLPAGTSRVVIAENALRGWQWRIDPRGAWTDCDATPDRAMAITLPSPLADDSELQLRFRPTHAAWVLLTLWAAVLVTGLLFAVPRVLRPT